LIISRETYRSSAETGDKHFAADEVDLSLLQVRNRWKTDGCDSGRKRERPLHFDDCDVVLNVEPGESLVGRKITHPVVAGFAHVIELADARKQIIVLYFMLGAILTFTKIIALY
jgi:hypothetical protein